MYFELQLSANVFSRIVRNRLKALPLCVDQEFIDDTEKDPPGSGKPVPLVVDRVEIGESTWIQREQTIQLKNRVPVHSEIATQIVWLFSPTSFTSHSVPFLQVKQEVRIHLVKSKDLDANGPNPTPAFNSLTIYPVFNVALRAAAQAVGSGGPLTLSYTLAHVDFGLLFLGLSAARRAEIEQSIGGIQIPPTTVDLAPLTPLLKRPVAAINAGIACDPAGTFVALRADFDVYASPPAVDRQFFEAGPADLLAGREWAMLVDADFLTRDAGEKAKSALEAAPKVRLRSGPSASFDPSGPALGIIAGAELVDACPFFIDNIDMDVRVTVRTDFSVPTPNTLRAHFYLHGEPSDLSEEIGCAVTGALLWPFVGTALFLGGDIDWGVYIRAVAFGPLWAFGSLLAYIESQTLSDDISGSLGSSCVKQNDEHYECNEVVDLTMALTPGFNSRLELEDVHGVPEGLVFGGTVSNLRDFQLGSLEPIHVAPFSWQIVGRCRGNGQDNFSVASQARISVFGTPPAGLCKAYLLPDSAADFLLTASDDTVTVTPRSPPGALPRVEPCRVRLVTNRGVRTISLERPVAITRAEQRNLESARLRAVASCYFWERMVTPIEKLRWLPDPPFRDGRTVQFWQIVVRGLLAGDRIRVEGRPGATLMSARPSAAGVAHLSLLFGGEDAPPELSLELRGERTEDGIVSERSVQQVLFEHRASLPVYGELRGLWFEEDARGRGLVIEDARHHRTWDVNVPVAPTLLRTAAGRKPAGCGEVLVQTGKRVDAAPTPHMRRALERLRDRIGQPAVVGSPRVGGFLETLCVSTGRGSTLYDISDPDEPCEVQIHEHPAWYQGVALGGRLMARHDSNRKVVDLYAAVASRSE